MIFGFETNSVDNPNYGRFFFEEWNKNKSFSQAWLDASWRTVSRAGADRGRVRRDAGRGSEPAQYGAGVFRAGGVQELVGVAVSTVPRCSVTR